MRLLLDSHFCFWLALRNDRLSAAELAAILEPENDVAFSSVAIWELRIKWDSKFVSGERKGEANPADVLAYLREADVNSVDLTPELAAAVLRHPVAHDDPFDVLLLTIAQETKRLLLTRDTMLRNHPLVHFAK